MWKKALWVYLGLYVCGVIGVLANSTIKEIQAGEFQISTLIWSLFLFLPPAMLALFLRGKHVMLIFTLASLLIIVPLVVGILNFNEMSLATIGKVLIFIPMVVGLVYFGWKQLFKKKTA